MNRYLMMLAGVALMGCGEGSGADAQPDEPCNKAGCPSEGQDCKRYRENKGDAQVTYYLCVEVLPLGSECEDREECAGDNNCNSMEGGGVGQRYCTDGCYPDRGAEACPDGFFCNPEGPGGHSGRCYPDSAI